MVHRVELDAAGEAAFQKHLVALIPHIRAFARSLTRDHAKGDDLAQDAIAKAWAGRASYQPGTNLKAWIFMILRNQFLSDKRRDWRANQLDPEVAERSLLATDNPSAVLELDELRLAMDDLPETQRQALILVGAGGMSYEEAAEICQCPVGTVKSRVSRARVAVAQALETGTYSRDGSRAGAASATIQAALDRLEPVAAPRRQSPDK